MLNEGVENDASHRRLAEVVMPGFDRQLAGDNSGSQLVVIFEDFVQITATGGGHGAKAPIVESEQVGFACLG